MEDSDIAVCFSNNKKYLASWKPKPKKESKPARTLKQNPAKVKEKISKEKRTKKPQKPFSLPVSKIPKPTTVKRTEAEYDEEKEDDEVKYTNETLEVPDGIGDILKGCLRHAILSEHEEKEL